MITRLSLFLLVFFVVLFAPCASAREQDADLHATVYNQDGFNKAIIRTVMKGGSSLSVTLQLSLTNEKKSSRASTKGGAKARSKDKQKRENEDEDADETPVVDMEAHLRGKSAVDLLTAMVEHSPVYMFCSSWKGVGGPQQWQISLKVDDSAYALAAHRNKDLRKKVCKDARELLGSMEECLAKIVKPDMDDKAKIDALDAYFRRSDYMRERGNHVLKRINGRKGCFAYNVLMFLALQMNNIECCIVRGKDPVKRSWEWIMVKENDTWYHFDQMNRVKWATDQMMRKGKYTWDPSIYPVSVSVLGSSSW